MRIFLIISFVFHLTGLLAQQGSSCLKIRLVDSEFTSNNVRNARVFIKNNESESLFISNSKGQVITCNFFGDVSIFISHVGYENIDTVINVHSVKDTIELKLVMHVKSYVGKEVVITNPFEPIQLFGSERLSVQDFEMVDNEKMVLLTYERKLNKGAEILLVDDEETILFATRAGNNAHELIRDFRGNIHLRTESAIFHLVPTDDDLSIYQMDKEYFTKYVEPIIDTVEYKVYFSNYQEIYPAVDYFSFDRLDSLYLKITQVTDDVMMEMYLAEYKYVDVRTKLLAREMEQELGVDKEVIIGASVFTNSIFYKEIYAPLFVRNDTLFVFDYYNEKLFSYTMFGDAIDTLHITHHLQPKKTGWKNQLIQDRLTGQIFAVYEKAGYTTLRHIDLMTGQLGEGIQLNFKYVDKLRLSGNAAFYIYRPFESAQKKFLYKERLPLNFQNSKMLSGDAFIQKND
jgi:hypothetical protein